MNLSETAVRDTFVSKLSELVEFAVAQQMNPVEIIGRLEGVKLAVFWEAAKESDREIAERVKGTSTEH